MLVFVSQPMSGLDEQEIRVVREKVFGDYSVDNPDAVLLDHYEDIKLRAAELESCKHPDVAMLAEAISVLAEADVVIFAKGWEHARGCRIEDKVATYYDIKKVYAK